MILAIGIFNCQATNWRIHLQGALKWLQSIERSAWKRNRNASIIYEMFLCLEALRPAQRSLALDLEPCNLYLEDATIAQNDSSEMDCLLVYNDDNDRSCRLDTVCGITEPILEVIVQINNWMYSGRRPPPSESQKLELKLILNDPDTLQLSCPTVEENMMRLNGCLYHVATYLYFSRSLQNVPLYSAQHLVRRGIELLDMIAILEAGRNVSGLLWPAFIIGCEADEAKSRDRVDAYCDHRERYRIGNVTDARNVLQKVWKRRDRMKRSADVTWHEVTADLGINILLS